MLKNHQKTAILEIFIFKNLNYSKMLRKTLTWLVKLLIFIILTTLIFSTLSITPESLALGAFAGIFDYSSLEVQEKFVNQLSAACPSSLKTEGLCDDYKSGKINSKEFFLHFIEKSFVNQRINANNFGFLQKYGGLISYLSSHNGTYFIALLVLLPLLYFLVKSPIRFLVIMSRILFSIGILIVLPYVGILIYDKFIGINTTNILATLIGQGSGFNPKDILNIILIVILKTYNNIILVIGTLLLLIGSSGRIYSFILKKRFNKNKIKTKNK